MPRYFFDVRDGLITNDDMGMELATVADARQMATEILYDLTREMPADGSLMEHEVIVRSNDGTRLLKAIMTFRCVELA